MTPIVDGSDITPYDDSYNLKNPRYNSSDVVGGETDAFEKRSFEAHQKWEEGNPVDDYPYPTEWHTINALLDIECRQVSVDSYELVSPTHTMTLNKEGFDLYRDDSLAGQAIFSDWCRRKNVEPTLVGNTNAES